jgi:hypothetical protein
MRELLSKVGLNPLTSLSISKPITLPKIFRDGAKANPKPQISFRSLRIKFTTYKCALPTSKTLASKKIFNTNTVSSWPRKPTINSAIKRTGMLRGIEIPISSTNPSLKEPKEIPLPTFQNLMAPSPPPKNSWL